LIQVKFIEHLNAGEVKMYIINETNDKNSFEILQSSVTLFGVAEICRLTL